MQRTERLRRFDIASRTLAQLPDSEIDSLISAAQILGSGIGGETFRIVVDDVPVFVKRITVTAREHRLSATRPTSNLFDLPNFCHYGIGSPGFGAWRELAAIDITSAWVLAGETDCFPLTYHWRVLAGATPELHEELSDIPSVVRYWNGSRALRTRLDALASATSVAWVFLEYLPATLGQWLAGQVGRNDVDWDPDLRMIERNLNAAVDFMAGNGFIHFDAHFDNILTDGNELYFADLGLAMSTDFDLRRNERDFFQTHRDYDRSYAFTYLTRWILTELGGIEREHHQAAIDDVLAGRSSTTLPPSAARIVDRYAAIAATMMPFYRDLQSVSRTTPYPRIAEQDAWAVVRASQ